MQYLKANRKPKRVSKKTAGTYFNKSNANKKVS